MSDTITRKPGSSKQATKRLVKAIVLMTVAVLLVNFVAWVVEPAEPGPEERDARGAGDSGTDEGPPLARSFDGPSDRLTQTQIVPALQSPITAEQSALWCGTANLAWRKFQDEVTKTPVTLKDAEELSRWLNQEPPPELEPEHYYVAAGWYKDGILQTIRRELPARFPNAPLPPEPAAPAELRAGLAYCYLEANIKYLFHFRENGEPFPFKDAQGRTTNVKSFGIRAVDKGNSGFRGQVRVLFRQGNEFAVDLSSETKPYQIILARIPPKRTLGETLAELDRRIADGVAVALGSHATLLVPTMCWRIQHRFPELEKKLLKMPGWELYYLDEIDQLLDFRLDYRGALLVSTFRISSTLINGDEEPSNPDDFLFDRPFLVVLKKRGGRPFFVLWVANAELLYPHE